VRIIRSVTLGLVLVAGAVTQAQEAAQDAERIAVLVAKAGVYVDEYEKRFSAIVGEERQTQRVVRANGSIKQQRELVSDLLLVKIGDSTLQFRDVIRVDGKAVRNRQDRLRTLFLEAPTTAVKQSQAIARESSRYNIGFRRGLEGLMIPLVIVRPTVASGFRFAATTEGASFEEFRSPSIIGFVTGSKRRDMFLKGTLGIDPEGGRLLAGSLVAHNNEFEITIDVHYAEDAALRLLVPSELRERYRKTTRPNDDRLEVTASYGKFRQFQVAVDERIDLPR